MGKMHEVLAVENELKQKSGQVTNDTISIFQKPEKFIEKIRSYQPKNDEGDKLPNEEKAMEETVQDVISNYERAISKTLDCIAQKEIANTEAKADLVVGNKILLENVPATLLLALEKELASIKTIYSLIPVLDPTKVWTKDENKGTFKAKEIETFRTEKVLATHIAHEATKEHPAQTQTYSKDVIVGTWLNKEWSSAITQKEKNELIGKIETLIRATKKARMRANEIEVKEIEIGKVIFDYLK